MTEKHEQELIATRGLPGSGKSTWSVEWVKEDPKNRLRVNLDDLRMEMFQSYVLKDANGGVDREKENLVFDTASALMRRGLENGKSVVFDATNTGMKNKSLYDMVARSYQKRTGNKVTFRTQDFPISIEEAIKRNQARDEDRNVPESSIRRMAANLGPNGEFPHIDGTHPIRKIVFPSVRRQAICVDMDGTLTDVRPVRHHLLGRYRNFDRFHRQSLFCPPNMSVLEQVMEAHKRGFAIVITTARQNQYREVTQKWLDDLGVPYENIFMRSDKDSRPDYEVKKDMLRNDVLPKYDVVRCIDDNPQAIRAWEEEGLTVTKVPFVDEDNKHLYEGKELPIDTPLFQEGTCVRCGKPISKGVIGPRCSQLR